MRVNNIPVRYIGEVFSPNYSVHTREFLSVAHAVETLRDLPLGCESDEIVLWPTDVHDSQGEAHSRTSSMDYASHRLSRGPRGGIRVERV